MNMKCISIDAAYENKECDPYSTDYDATMTQTREDTDNIISYKTTLECTQTMEEDWCKRRVCLTDLAFMTEAYWLGALGKYANTKAYGHTKRVYNELSDLYETVLNEDFDPISQCNNNFKGNGPTDTTGLKCCGDYPDRTLYNPLDRTTQCCVYSYIHHFSSASDSGDINGKTQYNHYNFPKNIGKIYNQHEQICTEFGVAG